MEDLVTQLKNAYSGKRILVTGHNGFKGTWLVALLNYLGADVYGISLGISDDSPFKSFHDKGLHTGFIQDIRDHPAVNGLLNKIKPELVFHLAAQALVLESYQRPRETFEVNVLGTANILDSLRNISCKGVIVATTDKVYKNNNSGKHFKEGDVLWGHDPYSLSKTGTELVCTAWRSLLSEYKIKIVSVRAGNVVGPGDRSGNRLLPDLIRAARNGHPAVLRNPKSVRPWQYVLDPLMGYLILGLNIIQGKNVADAYNFGPSDSSFVTVEDFTSIFSSIQNVTIEIEIDRSDKESQLLILNSDLAKEDLNWESTTGLHDAIQHTILMESQGFSEDDVYNHIKNYLCKF